MHSCSGNFSALGTISSLIISEIFAACFSCSYKFSLSHSSKGSDDKNIVFEKDFFLCDDETQEAETIIPGYLSNVIGDLYLVLLLPGALSPKNFSFAKSNNFFNHHF